MGKNDQEKQESEPTHDLELGIALAAIVVVVLITLAGKLDLSALF